MNKKGFTLIELLIVVAIIAIGATVVISVVSGRSNLPQLAAAPAQPDRATNTLQASGFKDISLRQPSWFACGKDDSIFMSNDFTATNPVGAQVSGTVCCGFFKGCTVRF